MYIIEVTEDKYEQLAKHAEEMLRHGDMLMQCLDSLKDNKTGSMQRGQRMPMSPHTGQRAQDNDYEDEGEINMRYGRGNGRNMDFRPDYDRNIGYRRY